MFRLSFVTIAVLLAACWHGEPVAPAVPTCVAASPAYPSAFWQYVRQNGVDVDSFVVANRATEPQRNADTVTVFEGGMRVIIVKRDNLCQTLYDSLAHRFNPPIVRPLD